MQKIKQISARIYVEKKSLLMIAGIVFNSTAEIKGYNIEVANI